MLLYPGNTKTEFKIFTNEFDNPKINCKLGFISIIDEKGELDDLIGENVCNLLEL